MIRESCGVGVVFFDLEVRLVVEQSIEHVRGISYGRGDYLGVKRRVLVGQVGVEEHSGFGDVTKVDLARLLPVSSRICQAESHDNLAIEVPDGKC